MDSEDFFGEMPFTSLLGVEVTEAEDGSAVEWLEPVTDAQFGGKD